MKKKGTQPRKSGARLGQHFLTGAWAARKLAEAAEIAAGDIVLEIGPGKGALTKEILKAGGRVIAIEKDSALVAYLRENLPHEHLTIVDADVRAIDPARIGLAPGGYILAANIPYYITGEILRQFLSSTTPPRRAALLIQKEVAERILARGGKESILSLSVKAYGEPSIAAKVSKGNFSPPPSVDSAILVVKHISRDFFADIDEKFFFEVVRRGFSSKRKMLANNLGAYFGREKVLCALAELRVSEKIRAEDVVLSQWKEIARIIGTSPSS